MHIHVVRQRGVRIRLSHVVPAPASLVVHALLDASNLCLYAHLLCLIVVSIALYILVASIYTNTLLCLSAVQTQTNAVINN